MPHYLWALRPYFRQTAGALALGSLAGIVMNTAVVLPPILLGRAIDAALALQRGQASTEALAWAALALIGGTLLTEGPRILKRWWLMTGNARIRANIRADVVRGILATPPAELHRVPIGDLMARVIGDVEVLGVGVREFIIETWDTVLFSLSLVVAMVLIDARLAGLALLPVPLALLLSYAAGRQVAARTRAAREANAALTGLIQEQLTGIRVLRLFGRADASVAQVNMLAGQQAATNLRVVQLRAGLQPVYQLLLTAGVVPLIWLGGTQVLAGEMSIGALVALLQLYARFIGRGFRIPQLANSIQSGGAAYVRIRPWLAPALPAAGEPRWSSFRANHLAGAAPGGPPAPMARSGPLAVTLRDVVFRYPGAARPALNRISLNIPAGALIAVTGPVGAGKSALAQALLGLLPRDAGAVLLNGRPLEAFPPAERAACIGFLPQEPALFAGTIRENVLLATPETPTTDTQAQAVAWSVDLVALDADLRAMPQGLETPIGEEGVRVSGGQRQRIALARALVAATPARPGLLVLDDPFSAVDVETEAQIIAALRAAFGQAAPPERRATIILISHRLAAFPQADQVILLADRRVAEQGTHAKLIAAGGLYARIFGAQQRASAPATVIPS
jgi:ABC-type multidrug transport system fused ATPase/permease subunit